MLLAVILHILPFILMQGTIATPDGVTKVFGDRYGFPIVALVMQLSHSEDSAPAKQLVYQPHFFTLRCFRR